MDLNNEEKMLIKELRMDPRWGSILDKINDSRRVPRYAPGKEKSDWEYRSGIDVGIENVLGYLGYD